MQAHEKPRKFANFFVRRRPDCRRRVYRQGKITLQELRLQLYRAVEHGLLLPLFSG